MRFVPPRAASRPDAAAGRSESAVATSSSAVPGATDKLSGATSDGGHRYNCRPRRPVCYVDFEEPDFDEFIWCEQCADYVYEYCSIHLPLVVLPDHEVPEQIDNFKLTRAELSLPTPFLHIAPSAIPGAGMGVFTTVPMPKGVRFGPYKGQLQPDNNNSPYSWKIHGTSKRKDRLINAEDPNKSNWMRYVNCSRNWFEQNCAAFQYQGQIYYRTLKNIPRGRELLVFYGGEFAERLGIDLIMYNAPRSRHTGMCRPESQHDTQRIETAPQPAHTDTSKLNSIQLLAHASGAPAPIAPKDTTHCDDISASMTNSHEVKPIDNVYSKKFQCEICHKVFSWKSNLLVHMRVHNYEPALHKIPSQQNKSLIDQCIQFECHSCHNIFIWKSELVTHMQVHTVEKPYGGKSCGKKFNINSNLITHVRLRTGEKPYECKSCGKKLNMDSDLTRHMRLHNGEKPYECKSCGKKFNINSNLTRHMRLHTGEKPYDCKSCGKKFNINSNLTRHMRLHTGEKPYDCKSCGKKFNQNSVLIRHMRLHTGEKPYDCKSCGKKFNRNSSLITHMRLHTGEKPYDCKSCGKKFNQNSQLIRHMRLHTGEL